MRSVAPTLMEGSRPQATIGNQITAKAAKIAKTEPEFTAKTKGLSH